MDVNTPIFPPKEPKAKKWKIAYNAPFTLSFCLIAGIMVLFNLYLNDEPNTALALLPNLSLSSIYRLLTYTLCHANFQHYLGNTLFLLMLGPILEEKYGTPKLFLMAIVTAITTGLINALLFSNAIIGASGIVFMFIVLASVVNIKEKEIPLSFLFVLIIYIGGEVLKSFDEDNISQFAHILGGIMGGIFGFLLQKKQKN